MLGGKELLFTSLLAAAAVMILPSSYSAVAETQLPAAKPVPDVQVIPLPYEQASFRHRGRELTRFHFGPSLRRPFCYPLT
ncbi:MAG: hypothetical protein JXM70_15325, partial [Pirellulales bacterium]|nr:hypothetical protein [Pirellulales bacterium]